MCKPNAAPLPQLPYQWPLAKLGSALFVKQPVGLPLVTGTLSYWFKLAAIKLMELTTDFLQHNADFKKNRLGMMRLLQQSCLSDGRQWCRNLSHLLFPYDHASVDQYAVFRYFKFARNMAFQVLEAFDC